MNAIATGIKKLFINLPDFGVGDWWVEVTTSSPQCVYYFGPFLNFIEASNLCPAYVEDLVAEGAQNITTAIKRCYPAELTKFYEDN
ncbi:DUF1816 domain-containing protein [Pseudanabaena sp. PCC 6802]|uniref:DUF1816 domain-containing protein n=1 Tax=Pseudanabaena sp. PCC 6802 TaxID=118173 RepID=UPI00034885B6|nr:DUF1816 domain-containing protein [Pseudanabaena sp. PCC 6802]